jgi:hypothetical protein
VVSFTSSSVSTSLTRWEWTEYIAEAFVVLGCLGELVAEVGEKWLGERRSKRLERWSTVVLILALMVSLKALVRTNELSGFVIGSLGDKADRADAKAQTALADSATASGEAAQSKLTAEGAKIEADSTDKELDTVQSQVAAVSKKAQTLDWTMAQVQFLSSRYLLDPSGLKTELNAFRGMPIIFRSYLSDGDGYFLCKSMFRLAKRREFSQQTSAVCCLHRFRSSQAFPSQGRMTIRCWRYRRRLAGRPRSGRVLGRSGTHHTRQTGSSLLE